MPRIIFGKSSGSAAHDKVIELLGALTNINWGFVKYHGYVQYITSREIPVTIIILYPNFYKYLGDFRVDIAVTIPESCHQEFIITHQLAERLLKIQKVPAGIKNIIQNWYNAARSTYNKITSDITDEPISIGAHQVIDVWLDECRI